MKGKLVILFFTVVFSVILYSCVQDVLETDSADPEDFDLSAGKSFFEKTIGTVSGFGYVSFV